MSKRRVDEQTEPSDLEKLSAKIGDLTVLGERILVVMERRAVEERREFEDLLYILGEIRSSLMPRENPSTGWGLSMKK
jgi:hypothetical protein